MLLSATIGFSLELYVIAYRLRKTVKLFIRKTGNPLKVKRTGRIHRWDSLVLRHIFSYHLNLCRLVDHQRLKQ